MRAPELWRSPAKSLQGEPVRSVTLTGDGLEGDRRFAIYDVETGFGLTGRRVPELPFASARLRDDGGVYITMPDSSLARDDEALSEWLGRRVTLRVEYRRGARRYEPPVVDFAQEIERDRASFEGAPGAFHDLPEARLSLVSTATIRSWDPRRFRSNGLLDGNGEDALVGSQVTLGNAILSVGTRIERCVMMARRQPGAIECDLQVLRTIARERDARLAVGALVARPGSASRRPTRTPSKRPGYSLSEFPTASCCDHR